MGNSLKYIGAFLCLAQLGGYAQSVQWQDDGSFDYSGHLSRTPRYPGENDGPMNPIYTASRIEPDRIRASVGGFAWLPNGDLLVLDFVDLQSRNGALIILKDINDPTKTVTSETILDNFFEPLGLQIVDDIIYVNDQEGIWRVEKDAGGSYTKTMFSPRPVEPKGRERYPFAFSLEHANGALYYAIGSHRVNSSQLGHGYVYKVDLNTGDVETLNSGMRMPNGMGVIKATGDVFYSDNQGQWRKASPVFHVQKDVYNGHPSGSPPADPITPPAVWLPSNSRSNYGAMTRSTTNLHEVENGIYKGQFLMGDNFLGRVNRVFFEKVKGVYQGGHSHFSNTVRGGVQHFIEGPDGTLFGGALGTDNSSGWNWEGVLGGITKWVPNQQGIMDILAVRSNREGFDLEFTEPLKASDIRPENFWVVSYEYNQWSENYGGSPEDVKRMRITALESSEDRKQLSLTIDGLAKGRVYNFFVKNDLTSEAGNTIYFPWAWYTLNEISDKDPLVTSGIKPISRAETGFHYDLQGRRMAISHSRWQNFSVKAFSPSGKVVFQSETKALQGKASLHFSEKGVYILRITSPGGSFSKQIVVM